MLAYIHQIHKTKCMNESESELFPLWPFHWKLLDTGLLSLDLSPVTTSYYRIPEG